MNTKTLDLSVLKNALNRLVEGNDRSLLKNDWTKWKIFREMRSKSSHTYDEQIAKEVVSIIPDFIDEAKFLLTQVENKNV